MTLDQLRIFIAVAEREHVTRAAQALHLTQSAVSGAVAALEQRHGVRLFDRVGRAILLNAAGRAFLAEARAVLARARAAEAALDDLGALRRGKLAIHASQTITGHWLPPRLVAFRAAHPGLTLEIALGNTAQVARAVADGDAELGLVEGAVDHPALSVEPVDTDRLDILVPPTHPWADGAPIAPDDLRRADWVLREPGSGTRSTFESALQSFGIPPEHLRIAMTLPSNEAVLTAVAAGAGAAAISASAAAPWCDSGRLRRAGLALPARVYAMLRHRERYHSRAGDAFAALARAAPT